MVLGFLSLFWIEFDVTTLAAILALIGYSNNETIVIFDRVRENLINLRRMEILDVVNLSVNQTLLRSVITHLTTLLVLTALFDAGRTQRAQLLGGVDRRRDRRDLFVDLRLDQSRGAAGRLPR